MLPIPITFLLTLDRLVPLTLPEHIRVLLERTADELRLLPEVGCEETVCVCDSGKCGLEGVLKSLGAASGGRVCVGDTGKL